MTQLETHATAPEHGPVQSALLAAVATTLEALFGEPWAACDPDGEGFLGEPRVASVAVNGDEPGVIVLRVDDCVAGDYAASMFDTEPGTASEQDVADSLLEFTNVLGGATKTVMEGECHLGLPVHGVEAALGELLANRPHGAGVYTCCVASLEGRGIVEVFLVDAAAVPGERGLQ